ncbi:zona pellucida sperm-binding protein 2 [Mixophyes fleayi]|uniref:zona pellucida sperm-binding protein 2 n=1 Tax=Mixophyes fleayi TaxID=3061075 RepID=UPI003F4D99D3
MGCSNKGTMFWIKIFSDPRFLFISCFLLLADAADFLDFQGSTVCLEDGIQTTKPKEIHQRSWQSLHVVDSDGLEMEACDIHPYGNLLTIPERCVTYEEGRMAAYISLEESMGQRSLIYRVSCDEQSDSAYMEPVIECNKDYMMARLLRTLTGFDDEVPSTPPPASTWMIGIYNRTLQKVNVPTARSLGYTLSTDPNYIMIRINFNAYGIQEIVFANQKFYHGYIELIQEKINPKITIAVKIICARGPPVCNSTHMTILIPPLAGVLQYIELGDIPVSLSASDLQMHGMTLDTRYGVNLSIRIDHLQEDKQSGQKSYYLPSLLLTFNIDGVSVTMALRPSCSLLQSNPVFISCTTDGFMIVQVMASQTKPNLDLNTVTLRDRTCQPYNKSDNVIVFQIPLNDCGTTIRFVEGKVFYENEVRALWRDLPPRKISRDSELRETVQCFYDGSDHAALNVNVVTPMPPVSARNDGPLSLVLNLYPDVSYGKPYSDDQYPVVKTLRDAVFLEVQVLNRNDPNIELVLDDCWATMFQDPKTYPQWNIVVDGCQENQDNYLTVFHPVLNVAQPSHRKRFEVKAFAFVLNDEPSTNLIYFHCSAIICNIQSPDSALCTKKCPMSRKRRDELFLNRHSTLVSLHGPVLFDSTPAMSYQDEQDVIKQVTIGVLPAFGLVAVVVLAAVMLCAFKNKSKS